jgi:hypothetical protein
MTLLKAFLKADIKVARRRRQRRRLNRWETARYFKRAYRAAGWTSGPVRYYRQQREANRDLTGWRDLWAQQEKALIFWAVSA